MSEDTVSVSRSKLREIVAGLNEVAERLEVLARGENTK